MPTQIKESASKKEVLRYISEQKLIEKINDSCLICVESAFEIEFEKNLIENFQMYSEEMETRGFNSFSEYAKHILPNAPGNIREELKYIQLEYVEDEIEIDYDIYNNE